MYIDSSIALYSRIEQKVSRASGFQRFATRSVGVGVGSFCWGYRWLLLLVIIIIVVIIGSGSSCGLECWFSRRFFGSLASWLACAPRGCGLGCGLGSGFPCWFSRRLECCLWRGPDCRRPRRRNCCWNRQYKFISRNDVMHQYHRGNQTPWSVKVCIQRIQK
jgi:amino acid transporter